MPKYIFIISVMLILFGCGSPHHLNHSEIQQQVVYIQNSAPRDSYKNNPKGIFEDFKNSTGVGLFITPNFILTAKHVIENTSPPYKINTMNTDKIKAKSFLIPSHLDITLIQVESPLQNIQTIPIQETDSMIGDTIYVYKKHSYFTGSITALDIDLTLNTTHDQGLVEIDIPAKPGDSGSVVINKNGEVVGVIIIGDTQDSNKSYIQPIQKNMIEHLLKNN